MREPAEAYDYESSLIEWLHGAVPFWVFSGSRSLLELARAEADDAGGVEGGFQMGGFGGNRQLQGRAVHGRPFVFAGCVLTELHRSWFQARQA